jgi:hypothetical protein
MHARTRLVAPLALAMLAAAPLSCRADTAASHLGNFTMAQGHPALEIALSTIPLLVTLLIHGVGMSVVQQQFEVRGVPIYRSGSRGRIFFAAMVIVMLLTHLVEMIVWAATLISLEAIHGFRDAFYYAAGTYTTLGYGEGMLPYGWRLMAPMMGISGLFAFGWTTGVLVNLVSQAYSERREGLATRGIHAADARAH